MAHQHELYVGDPNFISEFSEPQISYSICPCRLFIVISNLTYQKYLIPISDTLISFSVNVPQFSKDHYFQSATQG